jgi:hypothetical protein
MIDFHLPNFTVATTIIAVIIVLIQSLPLHSLHSAPLHPVRSPQDMSIDRPIFEYETPVFYDEADRRKPVREHPPISEEMDMDMEVDGWLLQVIMCIVCIVCVAFQGL